MARDFKRAAQAAAWLCTAVFSWLMGIGMAMAATTPSQFPIVDYQLVSKTAVAGSPTGQYDYVYRLQVRNAGNDVAGAQGAATSRRSSVIATDAEVSFPAIKARQLAVSSDTFSLRAGQFFDRRLDPKSRRNGRMAYDVPGTDPDDAQAGFAPLNLELGDVAINTWFVTKLNAVLEWRLQAVTDVTAPVISATLPLGNVASSRPVISASYADAGGAINTASVVLTLDGQPVSGAEVSATGIRYTPTTDLAQGAHALVLKVRDAAGNEASVNWNFTVLTSGPALTLTTPAEGEVLPADALPTLSGQWAVSQAGIDPASLSVRLDGQPVTAQISGNGFSATVAAALTEGPHSWTVSVRDTLGNAASRSGSFVTRSVPVIAGQSPFDVFLPTGASPAIVANFSDIGAGVDTARVRLWLDGMDVTAQAQVSATGIRYQAPQALSDGRHEVKLSIADRAGNAAVSDWGFALASAPEITATTPAAGELPAGSKPVISAQYRDVANGIARESVRLVVNDQDVTAKSVITDSSVSYTPADALPEGPYTVYVEVANRSNASTTQVWGFSVRSSTTYKVAFVTPSGPQTVVTPKVDVQVVVASNNSAASRVVLQGAEMAPAGMSDEGLVYTGTATLVDGLNRLQVSAEFEDGATRGATMEVTYDAPPKIVITSPADKAMLGRALATSPGDLTGSVERPVNITGRLSKPVVSVSINQQQALLQNGGLEFTFPNFFLREGTNMITAVATDAQGRVSSTAITVSVDQTAPILRVESPVQGWVTSDSRVDVRGMVNDAVEAMAGAPEPTVTVFVNDQPVSGGRPTQVADRYFLVPEVPLQLGDNRIVVSATDQFGNARAQELKVHRIAVGSSRLTLVGGNHQQGEAYAELAKPLQVVALNAAGEPLGNLAVRFDVTRGTGTISTTQGADTPVNGATAARNLSVTTDAFGRAQVWMKVGKQSGPGANVVEASLPEMGQPVTFVATTARGAVAKVNADLGISQFAETSAQPLELMSVIVRDRDDNTLPGVPVVYTVEEGDAYFADIPGAVARDGGRRLILSTDKNGLVAARPWIGTQPGVVRISAKAVKREGGDPDQAADLTGNATFVVRALAPVDGPAVFRGQVYTDRGQPLAGVRVSIARTSLSSTTDEQGGFELVNVPAGRIDLFVDGRTVNPTNDPARQQWPSLHFESFVVKGQENALPHPIYLPPLLTSSAKVVGGNEDVVLTIPGIDGFQMKVKANSVTFPDGSRVGTLVVSPVTADKLPMAPPAGGATFGVPAWTIQPAGTRFDPPIQVTLPNASGQPPGDNLPIVQWDHDLGQYVPMGRATVSEDGAVLVTDAGSGLTKAGWGGLCRYDPDKCSKNKPDCEFCKAPSQQGSECPTCDWDPSQNNKESDKAKVVTYELKMGESKAQQVTMKLLKALWLESVKWKMKSKVQFGEREICCANERRIGKNLNVSAFADFEAEAEGDVLPAKAIIKKGLINLIKKIVPNAAGDIDVGVFAKVKATAGFNTPSLVRKGCDKVWQVTGGITLSGTGELEARLSGETSITDKDGKVIKAKVVPLAGGITASGGAVVKNNGKALPSWDGKATLYWFIKSEIEVWNFKESIVWYADTFDAYMDGHLEFLPVSD